MPTNSPSHPSDGPEQPHATRAGPEVAHEPTCSSHLPNNETQGTTVPPIRLLTTKGPLHHASHCKLEKISTETESSKREDIAVTITQAIRQLEGLVEEAVQLNHNTRWKQQDREDAAKSIPTKRTRRPSNAIAAKARRFLEDADDKKHPFESAVSSEHQEGTSCSGPAESPGGTGCEDLIDNRSALRACGPAHSKERSTKSNLAIPKVSKQINDLEFVRARPEHLTAPDRGIHLTFPSAMLRFETKSDATESRGRELEQVNAVSSKIKAKRSRRKHDQFSVEPRSSSLLGAHHARRGQARFKELPVLKVNSKDVTQDVEDTKSPPPARHGHERHFTQMFGVKSRECSINLANSNLPAGQGIDLKGWKHINVFNQPNHFDVHETCSHAPVARNWPVSRKRFTATVVCINTAALGIIMGIYSGEVPSIQYRIADFHHHFTILGNVVMYCGLAISTILFWPLPLLYGRKPFNIAGLCFVFGLQIPQGIAVSAWRMPETPTWRVLLLLSRALSGLAFGLVNVNLLATLLDLFGSSLQSHHPHGEVPDAYDLRRHGGGMGNWLGFWCWCSIGTLSVGFVVGAFIIDNSTVDWGFWTSLLFLMPVLLLNVVAPEVRRSAFRRTLADLVSDHDTFSRIGRGEVKMHLDSTGPSWWAEEVVAGLRLSARMLQQPGFVLLSFYAA